MLMRQIVSTKITLYSIRFVIEEEGNWGYIFLLHLQIKVRKQTALNTLTLIYDLNPNIVRFFVKFV